VPARWLVRLEACLAGQGHKIPRHPAAFWARRLDQPASPQPAAPPWPCPPVAARPRALAVTEIETLLRDPYAIYARHILKLSPLKPLEESADAADYGVLVHEGMREFLQKAALDWPADARGQLQAAMNRALAKAELRPALLSWWQPRLARIAAWVVDLEISRRSAGAPLDMAVECQGVWQIDGFELRGRADRIEIRRDGRLVILDYKTGSLPTQQDVESGLAPQLTLESVMAQHGAFGTKFARATGELTYWHLSGGYQEGKQQTLFKGDVTRIAATVEKVARQVPELLARFKQADFPYLAQPHPASAPRFSNYAQLARVAEWAALEDAD
jgi:ATP-dependent helicase/nuclease subunit B